MNNNRKYLIVAGALIVLVAVFWAFFSNDSKPIINWEKTYRKEDTNPYGTYLLYELLKSYEKKDSLYVLDRHLADTLKIEFEGKPKIYFFVGESMRLSNYSDMDSLLAFVKNGNIAFVSSEYLRNPFKEEIFVDSYFKEIEDSTLSLSFYHPDFSGKPKHEILYKTADTVSVYDWNYINMHQLFDDEESVKISYAEDDENKPVLVKVPYGKGWIYLHSVPLAFTNYSLLTENGLQYAENVLSHLPDGDIYWDKYSKLPYDIWDKSGYKRPQKSILQFILSQPSLQWAYYLLLITLLVYMIFQGKRRQKIIPAIETTENSSLEFVDMVSKLYRQQKQHNKLIQQQEKIFLNFVRNKYYISTQEIDKGLIGKLSKKTQISEREIESIFNGFRFAHSTFEISDNFLITLHQKIENFYKKAK
ncbi:MAG: hypothetical protein COA57_06065 [Flavobacteriales bacterium]|nr:MAG: hypothetical protein COA57_06065 [Flavobacteriales bacterium]